MGWSDQTVFWAVVFVRFLLPLFIPKFPLPAILACFLADAVDQTVFQSFTHLSLIGYQGYDKALDIFYLCIALLTTYRNWLSYPALQIGSLLFYLRIVGVLAFEITNWRPIMVWFPNAFEYYFIFYELLRSRWSPSQRNARFFLVSAVIIWIGIKIPQEYWIHVAHLDLTDLLKASVMRAPLEASWNQAIALRPFAFLWIVASAMAVLAALLLLVRRVAGPPQHALELTARDLPEEIDEARERDQHIAEGWRLFDIRLAEKTVLVGFVTVIFADVLPGVNAARAQLVGGTALIVTLNTFLRLRSARAERSIESAVMSFILLALTNLGVVFFADGILRRVGQGSLNVPATLFFLLLLTLIVTLYDRWRPVFDVRFRWRAVSEGPRTDPQT